MKRRLFALALAAALALTGCGIGGGTTTGGTSAPVLTALALKEPVYPAFPTFPQMPENDDWDAYYKEYDAYYQALEELRGEGLDQETVQTAQDFALRTTPLALVGQEGKNVIYSPLSLWCALAMAAQCAQGDSRSQVLDALGCDGVEELREQVSQVWRNLYTEDGVSSLLLANSIWLNDSLAGHYHQETLDILAEDYYAGTYSAPMGTETADLGVSRWIGEQTRGLIGGDSPVVKTDPNTLALLVSSLYYRAGWTDEFDPGKTEKDIFTAADGEENTVNFMHRTTRGNFLLREGYQAARLGTHLGEMVFVLPDEGVSPEVLLQDPAFLGSLDIHGADSFHGKIEWSVPKFDLESQLDLKELLKSMGITDLLDREKADLSALTDLEAWISGASQLARVKVDEEGVEAAAVTILEAATSAAPSENPDLCVMDLNRPFLFVIRLRNIPLFVGVVNQVE